MPSEPGIVEIDHRHPCSIDQHVARMQVRMNHAECSGRLAVASERRMQPISRIQQHGAFGGGEHGLVPERAPKRLEPHQPVGIEPMPLETGGRRPVGRLVMHRRHDRAHFAKSPALAAGSDLRATTSASSSPSNQRASPAHRCSPVEAISTWAKFSPARVRSGSGCRYAGLDQGRGSRCAPIAGQRCRGTRGGAAGGRAAIRLAHRSRGR